MVAIRPMRSLTTASALSSVSGSNRLERAMREATGPPAAARLSATNTVSNFAASAMRTISR